MSDYTTMTREELIAELEALQRHIRLQQTVIPEPADPDSKKSRVLLEAVLEQSPCGVLVACPRTGRVIFVNDEACRIDGVDKASHLAIDLNSLDQLAWTLHYPDGSPMLLTETPLAKATLFGKKVRTQEILLRRSDGTECWVLCNSNPLFDEKGELHSGIVTFVEITDHKNTTTETMFCDATYLRILGTGVDAYYKADMQGRLVMANIAAARILGYEHPDEIIGKHIASTFYESPEERVTFMQELLGRGKTISYPLCLKSTAGTPVMVEVSARLIPDAKGGYQGVEGLFRDVTAKAQAEEQLRRSEFFYRKLFENTGAATVLLDSSGRINRVNSQAEELSGYTKEELEGKKHWQDMIDPEDLGWMVDYHQRRISDGPPPPNEYDFTLVDKQGNKKFVRARIDFMQETGERIVCMADLTSRRKMEKELEELNHKLEILVTERTEALHKKNLELEAANQRLLELDEIKSNMLSSVSHELRTPLTSIMGFAKVTRNTFEKYFSQLLLTHKTLTPRASTISSNLGIITREGERLSRLINELLDLAHVESGQFRWNDTLCDMSELLSLSVASAYGEFQDKADVVFKFSIPENLPFIFADKDKIQQVVLNLLNNAAKFTEKGEVVLSVTADTHWIHISIADTGMGIPEHLLQHIFDKFYTVRTNDTLHASAVGTGLGLALCSQVVEHYGGKINVTSSPGQGSTFEICLPVAK